MIFTPGYPTYESLEKSLKAMRKHMVEHHVKQLAVSRKYFHSQLSLSFVFPQIPQIGCGLDRLQWPEVVDRLHRVFENDDIEITVYKYSHAATFPLSTSH
jgi:hypothetical protein